MMRVSAVGFAEPPRPVECEGDSCSTPFAPPAELTPASATFQGAGSETSPPEVKPPAVAKKKPKAKKKPRRRRRPRKQANQAKKAAKKAKKTRPSKGR